MVGFSGTRESGAGMLIAPNPREPRPVLPHALPPPLPESLPRLTKEGATSDR